MTAPHDALAEALRVLREIVNAQPLARRNPLDEGWKAADDAEKALNVLESALAVLRAGSGDSEPRGEFQGDGEAAAPVASPHSPMSFQWLVERGQPEGLTNPVWLEHSAWQPASHQAWTRNAWEAAMFPNRATAERYIADERLDARAVEHGFAARSVSPHDETLREAGQALRDAFPDSSWQGSRERADAADEWDEAVGR